METLEYRFTDKTGWGDGPWQGEPDKIQFPDPETGLPALIVRNRMGALCGYVGVGKSHPWYKIFYSELTTCGHIGCEKHGVHLRVHGDLTYSDLCVEDEKEHGICHIAGPDEEEPLWWFGFDCGHAFDICPAAEMRDLQRGLDPIRVGDESYKTVEYVKAEIAQLAAQLAAHEGGDR